MRFNLCFISVFQSCWREISQSASSWSDGDIRQKWIIEPHRNILFQENMISNSVIIVQMAKQHLKWPFQHHFLSKPATDYNHAHVTQWFARCEEVRKSAVALCFVHTHASSLMPFDDKSPSLPPFEWDHSTGVNAFALDLIKQFHLSRSVKVVSTRTKTICCSPVFMASF